MKKLPVKQEKNSYLSLIIILILTVIIFFPILKNQFTFYSDDVYVLNNPIIQNLSLHNINFIFSSYFDGHYHPLTLLSLGLTYQLSGVHPMLYQFTNLLLHLLNIVVLYFIIIKLFKNKNLAVIVVLLFAVHTIHVESVARITERKDMQYAFFFLLALFSYLKYVDSKKINYYYLSLALFILSLLSKGQAAPLPLVLILVDIYTKRDIRSNKIWIEKLPFILLSIGFLFLNYQAQKFTGYFSGNHYKSIFEPMFNASYVFDNYLFKLILPIDLSAQYDAPYIIGTGVPAKMYIYLILALAIISLFIVFLRKNNLYIFGGIFYLVNIFMVLRWFDIAENVMPDRYNYVASIGIFIILGVLYLKLKEKYKSVLYLGIAYIAFLCVSTFVRCSVWHDGLSVWKDAVKKNEKSVTSWYNLGSHYLIKGDVKNSLIALNNATKIDSTYLLSYITRKNIYSQINDTINTISQYISIYKLKINSGENYTNRSAIKSEICDYDGALNDVNNAINLDKFNSKYYFNRANILAMYGNKAKAIPDYDKVIEKKSFLTPEALYFRSIAYLETGNPTMAKKDVLEALEFIPKKEEFKDQLENIKIYEDNYADPNTISDTTILLGKGELFFKNKMYLVALPYFLRINELSNNTGSMSYAAFCYFYLGDFAKTKEMLFKLEKSGGKPKIKMLKNINMVEKYKDYIKNHS